MGNGSWWMERGKGANRALFGQLTVGVQSQASDAGSQTPKPEGTGAGQTVEERRHRNEERSMPALLAEGGGPGLDRAGEHRLADRPRIRGCNSTNTIQNKCSKVKTQFRPPTFTTLLHSHISSRTVNRKA